MSRMPFMLSINWREAWRTYVDSAAHDCTSRRAKVFGAKRRGRKIDRVGQKRQHCDDRQGSDTHVGKVVRPRGGEEPGKEQWRAGDRR